MKYVKNGIMALTLFLLVGAGMVSAVDDWLRTGNATIVSATMDNGSTVPAPVIGIWNSKSQAIAQVVTYPSIIVDGLNNSLSGNFILYNVTYNITNPQETGLTTTSPFNITSISIELIGKDANTTKAGYSLWWNGTTETNTTGPTTLTDSDGDGFVEAAYTGLVPTASLWRLQYNFTTKPGLNVTLTEPIKVVVTTTNNKLRDAEYSIGEKNIRVIGLGAGTAAQKVLINHTFNISSGSDVVNMSNMTVNYYFGGQAPAVNGTVQVFYKNGSAWINWTANTTKIGGTALQWNISMMGYGVNQAAAGASGTGQTLIDAPTSNWNVIYAVNAPYMSANTTVSSGTVDGSSLWQQDFTVTMNESGSISDVNNVTAMYVIDDNLYDGDFKMEVFNDNTSQWFDITPRSVCPTYNNFGVYGQTWYTCQRDTDGDSKPDIVNITIPSLSTRSFRMIADVSPGKIIVQGGSVQVCGDGMCGPGETSTQCARDCAGVVQTPGQTYTPQQVVQAESPKIQPIHVLLGIIAIVLILYGMKLRKQ